MINSNGNLAKFLHVVFKQMSKNYDIFLVIDGVEGVGKSRGLLLNILDYWYRRCLKYKKIPKWAINIDVKDWVNNLNNANQKEMIGLDEAGDSMDSMQFANKFNRLLYQAYTIIREKLSFSIVVLPSFFDLSSRFRKRRVRFLIHGYKRVDNRCNKCGYEFVGDSCPKCKSKNFKRGFLMFEIYDRQRINMILEYNLYRHTKKVRCGVAPLVRGTVREYQGELADYYSELKKQKMKEVLDKLSDNVNDLKGVKSCPHSSWRYVKKSNSWYCRSCGKEVFSNPYENGGVDNE